MKIKSALKLIRVNLILLWQQLWAQRKFVLFYVGIWTVMTAVFASLYPTLRENSDQLQQAIEAFPPQLAEVFGISSSYLSNVESYIGGELLTFIAIAGCATFAYLGYRSVAGKIDSGSITNLLAKPIPRSHIYIIEYISNSILSIIVNILFVVVMAGVFALFVPDELLEWRFLAGMGVNLSILFIFFAAVGQCLGLLLSSTAVVGGIGLAYSITAQIVNSVAQSVSLPDWVVFTSVFYYTDFRLLIQANDVDGPALLALWLASLCFVVVGVVLFRNKDIYV